MPVPCGRAKSRAKSALKDPIAMQRGKAAVEPPPPPLAAGVVLHLEEGPHGGLDLEEGLGLGLEEGIINTRN